MREHDDRYIEKILQSHHNTRPLSAKIVEKKTGVYFRPKGHRPISAKKTGISPVKRPETYLNSRIRPNQTNMDKERLYEENMSLKMQINAYKSELINTKTRLKQLEKENKRQNEEIEEISCYDKTPAHKYIRLTNALRKSIKDLRIECKQRDDEISRLKKHIKITKITELETEIITFRDECLRLKHNLEELLKRRTLDTPLNLPEAKPKDNSSSKKDHSEKKDIGPLILSLQEENRKLKEKLESYKSKSKNISKEAGKSLKQEIQKLKLQFEASNKEFTHKETTLKQEILRLKKSEEDFHRSSEQYELTIKSLQNQLKTIKNSSKSASQQLVPEPPPPLTPIEKTSVNRPVTRSPAKILHPLVVYSQVSHIFKHIYLSMQLHRLPLEKLSDVLLSKISEQDSKLPVSSIHKLFPNPPFAFVEKQNLIAFFQFLAQPDNVEFLETWEINTLASKPIEIVEKILEKVPKWKIFGNEEETEFDNELAQLIRSNKNELFKNCLKYDEFENGVVEMKDFKLALKDSKIIFQPRLFEYVTLLFYSHEYEIEKVPYRNFLKAYGESPEEDEYIDEEKLQLIKSCLIQIAQALLNKKLTVREVFKSSGDLIYPESFTSGLEVLGIKSIDKETIIMVLEQLQYENETETCVSLFEFEKIMDSLGVGTLHKQDKKSYKSFSSKGSSDKSSNLKRNESDNYEYSIDSPDKYGISEISPFASVSNTDLIGKSSPTVNDYSKIDLEQIKDDSSESGSGEKMEEIQFSPGSVKKKENITARKPKSRRGDKDSSSGEDEGKTLEYSLTVAPVDKSVEHGGNRVNKTEDFEVPEESLKFFTSDPLHQSVDLQQPLSEKTPEKSFISLKMSAKELEDKEKHSEIYSSFDQYGSSDEEQSYREITLLKNEDVLEKPVERDLISSPIDSYNEYSEFKSKKGLKELDVYQEKEVFNILGSKKHEKVEDWKGKNKESSSERKKSSSSSSSSSKHKKKSSSSSSSSSKHKQKSSSSSSSGSETIKSSYSDSNKNEHKVEKDLNEHFYVENEVKFSLIDQGDKRDIVESYGNATFGEQFLKENIYEEQESELEQNQGFGSKNIIEISQATFSAPNRMSQEMLESGKMIESQEKNVENKVIKDSNTSESRDEAKKSESLSSSSSKSSESFNKNDKESLRVDPEINEDQGDLEVKTSENTEKSADFKEIDNKSHVIRSYQEENELIRSKSNKSNEDSNEKRLKKTKSNKSKSSKSESSESESSKSESSESESIEITSNKSKKSIQIKSKKSSSDSYKDKGLVIKSKESSSGSSKDKGSVKSEKNSSGKFKSNPSNPNELDTVEKNTQKMDPKEISPKSSKSKEGDTKEFKIQGSSLEESKSSKSSSKNFKSKESSFKHPKSSKSSSNKKQFIQKNEKNIESEENSFEIPEPEENKILTPFNNLELSLENPDSSKTSKKSLKSQSSEKSKSFSKNSKLSGTIEQHFIEKQEFLIEKNHPITQAAPMFIETKNEEIKQSDLIESEGYQLNKFPALPSKDKNGSSSDSLPSSKREGLVNLEQNSKSKQSLSKEKLKNSKSSDGSLKDKLNNEKKEENNEKSLFLDNTQPEPALLVHSNLSSSLEPKPVNDHVPLIPNLNSNPLKFNSSSSDSDSSSSSFISFNQSKNLSNSSQSLKKVPSSHSSEVIKPPVLESLTIIKPEISNDLTKNLTSILSQDPKSQHPLSNLPSMPESNPSEFQVDSSSISSSSSLINSKSESSYSEIKKMLKKEEESKNSSSSSSSEHEIKHPTKENPSDRFESQLKHSKSSSSGSDKSPNIPSSISSESSSSETLEVYSSNDSQSL